MTRTPAKKKKPPSTPSHPPAEGGASGRKVNVFISYAKADHSIAAALSEELKDINHDRVICFLDTESIGSGEAWLEKLEPALKVADWLVCIYTGDQSDFCGYEVGRFTDGKAVAHAPGESRVVCLYDVENYPILFQKHQNRHIEIPPERPAGTTFDENEFYKNSDLAKFFKDFCGYDDLCVTKDPGDAEKILLRIINKAKRITEAFANARGGDVETTTPTQLRFEVTVACKHGDTLSEIPATAQVQGTYDSFRPFGLMPPMQGQKMQDQRMPTTSWGKVKEACQSPFTARVTWIERLERDMLDAANARLLSEPEAEFWGRNDKIYRAILYEHTLYWNGTHGFHIILVETPARQFLSQNKASQILALLMVAARFRSLYLQDLNKTAAKFDDKLPDSQFQGNYWQFLGDLELMKEEARELGLLDAKALVEAFGAGRQGAVESFLQASKKSRDALEKALPPRESFDPKDRAKLRGAIMQFLRETQIENAHFLRVAAEAYRDEQEQELTKSGA